MQLIEHAPPTAIETQMTHGVAAFHTFATEQLHRKVN